MGLWWTTFYRVVGFAGDSGGKVVDMFTLDTNITALKWTCVKLTILNLEYTLRSWASDSFKGGHCL